MKQNIVYPTSVDDRFINVFDGDVIVRSNESVTWYTPIVVTTLCKVQIRYFPFDSQTCNLTFQSWAYDSLSLDLQHLTDEDVSHYGNTSQARPHKGSDPNTRCLKKLLLFFIFNNFLPDALMILKLR